MRLGPAGEQHLAVAVQRRLEREHVRVGGAVIEQVVRRRAVAGALSDGIVEQRVGRARRPDRPGVHADLAARHQPVLPLPQLDHPVLAAVVEEDRLAVDVSADPERGGVVAVRVAEAPLQRVVTRVHDVLAGVVREPSEGDGLRDRRVRRPGIRHGRAPAVMIRLLAQRLIAWPPRIARITVSCRPSTRFMIPPPVVPNRPTWTRPPTANGPSNSMPAMLSKSSRSANGDRREGRETGEKGRSWREEEYREVSHCPFGMKEEFTPVSSAEYCDQ